MSITGAHHQLWALRRWDPAPYWTENISPLSQALQWQHTNEATSVVTAADVIMKKKIKVSYLVLVLQPASCCSWTRAANCCRSATSLPWACLMKGCSRRWVTDGRASKSFIRHLNTHTQKQKTEETFTHFKRTKPLQIRVNSNSQSPEHCGFVWISSDTSRGLVASVLKSLGH